MPPLRKMQFDGVSSGINVLTHAQAFLSKGSFGEYYYKQRRLAPKYANSFLLALFGISVVISGQYGLWNFGLRYGYGSMLIAFGIETTMFWNLVCSIAELSSLMPFTGGSSNFASLAFGPMAGIIEGYCFYSELLTFTTATMMAISVWICETSNLDASFQPLFWFLLVIFPIVIFSDVKMYLRINAVYCTMAIALILIYTFLMIPFTTNFAGNVLGSWNSLLPEGAAGVFYALPYATWFYVGIEAIPFLSEETANATRNIPKGLVSGMTILTFLSACVLLIVPGAAPGINAQETQHYPLNFSVISNFRIDPHSSLGAFVGFLFLSGNIASYLACAVGCHRSMYALSRAGFFPASLSLTFQKRGYGKGAPYNSIIATSILTIICASISFGLGDNEGQFLILMCIAYSLVSYTFTFISFIKLRFMLDQLNRPYTSPFGIPGAIIGAVCSIASFASIAFTYQLRYVLIAVAGQAVLAGIYYLAVVKTRVAFIPEKMFLQAQLKEARNANIVEERKRMSSPSGSGFSAPHDASSNWGREGKNNAIKKIPRPILKNFLAEARQAEEEEIKEEEIGVKEEKEEEGKQNLDDVESPGEVKSSNGVPIW